MSEPVIVELNQFQVQAIKRLQAGIKHHDSFGPETDDSNVYISGERSTTLYELPYDDGAMTLGDLRDLASIEVNTSGVDSNG